ncbi:MAG: protoglobin domain-containing protein [Gammaproteobacteria bacterium]|nr:protoglobin domain-containing protein [Gammaproteobacteria bacterium]
MKDIDKTLAEQLQITEREIELRKNLLHIGEQESKVLRSHLPVIEGRIDAIVERFYSKQIEISEIALVIGDAETLSRLKGAMHRYILELFAGYYDSEYVNKRLRIGMVHKRIGVSPKLYISAVWLLHEILNEEIDESLQGDGTDEVVLRRAIKEAMNKLFMFDIQMVFDTYIASLVSEVEVAKKDLETYAESLEEQVALRTRQLESLSREDALTGLNNQRTFYEILRHEMAVTERHQEELSLIYFDLNGFKKAP